MRTVERERCGARGFTLLEVLIALVILSIGLLGLAALFSSGLQSNHGAYMHTQATLLAYDMADRMRANTGGVTAGDYDSIALGVPSSWTNCATSGTNTPTDCSPAQVATFDDYQWESELKDLLPNGKGSVEKSGTNYVITVMWDDQHTGATGTNCSGNSQVDLTCFTTTFRP